MGKKRICRICCRDIPFDPLIAVPYNKAAANGGWAYVHRSHCQDTEYHSFLSRCVCDVTNAQHKKSKENVLIAPEYEFVWKREGVRHEDGTVLTHEQIRGALCLITGGVVTRDCTVDGELNVPPVQTLRGMRDRVGAIRQLVETDDERCGAHIHASVKGWAEDCITEAFCFSLFEPLREHLSEHREETISVFGRYFSEYAANTNFYGHGSWINACGNNIEYRLPHIVDADQYLVCADVCKQFTLVADKVLKGAATFNSGAREIITIFNMAANKLLASQHRALCISDNRKKNQK